MTQLPLRELSSGFLRAAAVLTFLSACAGKGVDEDVTPSVVAAFRPFEAVYLGITHGRVEQTFNNQVAESEFGLDYHLSVSVTEEQGALGVTLTLDSISRVTGFPGGSLSARIDSSRGAAFTARLARNGALEEFSGGESSGSLVRELSDRILEQFFPLIPTDGAQPGMQWTDTLTSEATVGGVENAVESINHSRAIEWTIFAGEQALYIETVSDYTFSGSGVQAGQDFSLQGNGRRHSHQYLSGDGVYLGFVSADTANAEAHLTDAGIVIPVQQIRADTLSISADTLSNPADTLSVDW